MKTLQVGAAIAVALSLSACATVTRGTKQKFTVTSEPPGADVRLTTGETCTTPCTLKLKRKNEFVVTVSKPGYQSVDMPVRGRMRGGGVAGAAGNVLIGGIVGGIVDGSNGSLLDLRPNPLALTLVPVAPPATAAMAVENPAPTAAPTEVSNVEPTAATPKQ
jgi:PEGA domain